MLTDEIRKEINATIHENHNIRLSLLDSHWEVTFGTVQHIMTEDLGYQKICARWIRWMLTPDQKTKQFCAKNGIGQLHASISPYYASHYT